MEEWLSWVGKGNLRTFFFKKNKNSELAQRNLDVFRV